MKPTHYCIYIAAAMMALTACTDENTFGTGFSPSLTGHYLHLSADKLTLGATTELQSQISVESVSTPWQFTGKNEGWLNITPTKGDTDATVVFSATENTSGSDIRTSLFTFQSTDALFSYSRQIAVTQNHATPFINTTQSNVTFNASQGSSTVGISTNVECEVHNDSPDWLNAQLSDNGESLLLTAAENLTTSNRSASVVLTGGGISTTISISQSRAATPQASPETFNAGPEGGTFDITVTSEVAWTVATSETWLGISPNSGQKGTAKIQLRVNPTLDTDSRSAFVYFYIGSTQVLALPVTQTGLSLSINPSDVILTANADEKQLQLSSNTSWTVMDKPSWLTVSPMAGTGDAILKLNVEYYWGSHDQEGKLTVGRQGTALNLQVNVTQLGRTVPSLLSQIVFGCEQSSKEVPLNTDGRWSVAVNGDNVESWLHVSPTAGTGQSTLTISATENTKEDVRQATVSVTIADSVQNIQVVQQGITPYILPERETVAITASEQNVTVAVMSNIEWNAVTEADWCSVQTSANGNGIVISAKENLTDQERQTTISISGSNVTKEIVVKQAKASAPVLETTATLEFDNTGGSYSLEVSSEVAWTASSPYEWLDVEPKEEKAGTHTLTISATPNTQTGSRDGFVYLYIGGRSMVAIPVHQRGIYIELSEHSLIFTADAQQQSLTVKGNTTWKVLQKPEWLTVSPTEGNGTCELTLSTGNYWGTTQRSGTLVIGQEGTTLSEQATVSQQPRTFPELIAQLQFDDGIGTKPVTINTDGQWKATTTAEWLTLSPDSGTGQATMQVTAAENTTDDERQASINVTVGDITRHIAVEQKGKYFTVRPTNNVTLTSKGGSHIVDITTNEYWTATPSSTWMEVTPTQGKGDATITLTAPDNASVNARNDTTTITPTNLQPVRIITQQAARYLRVDASTLPFHSKGGTKTVNVSTDGSWTVSATASWLTVNKTTESTFTVTADNNTDGNERNAVVNVVMTGLRQGEEYKLEIPVTQKYFLQQIDLQPFEGEQSWDLVTGTVSISLKGFSSDQSWDDSSGTKITISVTKFTAEAEWDNK